MSRPQFNQSPQQLQVAGGQVVNGGLIDFQDNLQRGVCEYATPQQLLASGYGGYPGAPGISQGPPMQAYSNNAIPSVTSSPFGNYPGYPSPAQLSSGSVGQSGGCFSGPPAFLQVGSVVYRPVDTDASGRTNTVSSSDPPPSVKASVPPVSNQATTKMLTEDDLHRAIDSRVQSKVESYLSSQRKSHHSVRSEEPHSYIPEHSSSSVRTHRGSSANTASPTARTSEGPVTRSARSRGASDEELAVQRVQQANASMRTAPSSSTRGSSRSSRGLDW